MRKPLPLSIPEDVVIFFLRLFGALLARLPESATRALVAVSAEAIFFIGRRRRRSLLANLTHAFPGRDYKWIVSTGRQSVREMVEFGLLAVALPCLSEKRLREIFSIPPESEKFLRERIAGGRPVVVFAPHLGPQDGLAILPLLLPEMPPSGAIYRPIKNQGVDLWIRESRERFGVKLFSRKQGLQSAIRLLRANRWLCLLFDQNASGQGALITFLDRVASVTELPGILAARHNAEAIYLYAARRRFWRIELRGEPGPDTKDKDEINFSAHLWLEKLLQDDEKLLPSWLWAHNRWRHQRVPQLALREKKNVLEEQNAFLKRDSVPRREPFFIRLPDRHEEVVALLPFLQAIRHSRPDAAVTVIGKEGFLPLAQDEGLCERAVPLPSRGIGYLFFFWRLRRRYPSAYFLFNETFGSEVEAWLTGAPHRFGVERPGRRRVFLNRPWVAPPGLSGRSEIWKAFLHSNGLEDPPELTRAGR